MSFFQFNARTVKPSEGFENWPEDWYKVVIRKSNIKETGDHTGGYLQFDIECIEGALAGRINFIRLNLFNKSQQAVEIANGTLSAICHVVGVYDVNADPIEDNASPMMHNIPFMAKATLAPRREPSVDGKPGKVIPGVFSQNFNSFKDVYGNVPSKAQGGATAMPPMTQPPAGMPMQQQQQPGYGQPPAGPPMGVASPPAQQWAPQQQQQPAQQPPAAGGWTSSPQQQPPAVSYPPAGQPMPAGYPTAPAGPPMQQQQPAQQQWQQQPAPAGQPPAGMPNAAPWGPQPGQAPGGAMPQQWQR